MGLILEFEDWKVVREEMHLVNEGLWDWLKKKMRKIFGKKHMVKMRELIASDIVDEMIDPKTGELTGVITTDDIKDAKSEDEIFGMIDDNVPEGKYFKQVMKFMRDAIKELIDKGYEMEIAGEKLGEEDELTPGEDAAAQGAGAIKTKSEEALAERGRAFDDIYKRAKNQVLKNTEAEINEYLKTIDKGKYPWIHSDVWRRFRNAQTVTLLIEYDIKKYRWNIEKVGDLKNDMVKAWQDTLKFSKELKEQVRKAEAQVEEFTPEDVKEKYKVEDEIEWVDNKGKVIASKILEFTDTGVQLQTIQKGTKFFAMYDAFIERMMRLKKEESEESTPEIIPVTA